MNVITRTCAAAASAACLSLALAACGGSYEAGATLRGTVSGASASGTVTVRDAAGQTRTTTTDARGGFAVDVKGLAAPLVLRAEWADAAGPQRLYGVARRPRSTAVNGFSDAVAQGATRSDDDEAAWRDGLRDDDLEDFLADLATVLKPLFDLYGIAPAADDDLEDSPAVAAMLADVRFRVRRGVLTVTNRASGGVIFEGPLRDLASGTFHPEHLPGGAGTPPPATCTYAYSAWGACQPDGTQTRTVISATPAGCTGTPALTQGCTYGTPPPGTCTYTYSPWGACQPSGTRTRTVLAATPAGCSGTPLLTQACTYVDGAALYQTYCAGCHGNSRKGSPASLIQGAIDNNAGGVMGSATLRALTPEQIAAIAAAP